MSKDKKLYFIFLILICIILYYALTSKFNKREKFTCLDSDLKLNNFDIKNEPNIINGYIGEQNQGIPKVIHQVWFMESVPCPLSKLENMKTWKIDYINKFPDFKYVLWTHEKIKNDLYWSDELKKIYNLEKTIKGKTDILKLVILQQYGGIFIDSDLIWNSKHNKNLNDLIYATQMQCSDFFVAREPYQNWISNNVIGASKNSKPLNYLLNKLEDIADGYLEIRQKTPLLEVTGSLFVNTVVLRGYPIVIFPEVFFYPRTRTDSKPCMILENIPANSYMISNFYANHW
jgi:mannosyltransferase OCH1-like enzyme